MPAHNKNVPAGSSNVHQTSLRVANIAKNTGFSVEADGPIHLFKKDYDKNHEEVLNGLGFIDLYLRFENDQILNDINSVIEKIKEHLG